VADPRPQEIAGRFASEHRPGHYVWTVKTWAQLRLAGFDCRLTDRLPDAGIVVAHRHWLRNTMWPKRDQLFVCIVADFYRHPFAQWHVVQNRDDRLLARPSPAWPANFLPHWSETGLIPRDAARGERFENVAYYGQPERLAPQLRDARFARRLREHGFDFRIVERERWNDYSNTDAVLAVRSFAALPFYKFPPSKLYNAWFAGVPALLGRESAYRAERRSALDYFEVTSTEEVLGTLLRLREDRALREAAAGNAALRAREVQPARLAEQWIAFLTTQAIPAWRQWRERSATSRRAFLAARALRYAGFVGVDFVLRGARFLRRQARGLLP